MQSRHELTAVAHQLLAQPDLCRRLDAFDRPDAFLQALSAELGADSGFGSIQQAYHSGGLVLRLGHWPPAGWLPIGQTGDCAADDMAWAWFGDEQVNAPFFDDAIRTARYRPINRFVRIITSFDCLIEGHNAVDPVPLSGLIFHMSRCGSTLVANMLGAIATHLVYSEPQPLDVAIADASRPGVSTERAVALVKATVAALGRRRATGASRLFIKCDAWHIRALPLLRMAFPQVPWLYLFREPEAVLASHLAQPGRHMVPGIVVPPLVDAQGLSREIYMVKALQAVGEAAVDHWSLGGGMAMDYDDLVDDGFRKIAVHFGFEPSVEDRAALDCKRRANAKYPDQQFSGDAVGRLSLINAELRLACNTHLQPVHAQLLTLAAEG